MDDKHVYMVFALGINSKDSNKCVQWIQLFSVVKGDCLQNMQNLLKIIFFNQNVVLLGYYHSPILDFTLLYQPQNTSEAPMTGSSAQDQVVPLLQFRVLLGNVCIIFQTDPSSLVRDQPQNDKCRLDRTLGKLDLPDCSGSGHTDNDTYWLKSACYTLKRQP